MPTVYFCTILSVIIVSLVSFIGILSFALNNEKLRRITLLLIGLSTGTLLGDAFLHLLPEAIADNGGDMQTWYWLLGGIIIFFILEKIIHWRHCHIQPSENHLHPLGAMNLIGDGLHNFIDGIIIASSFMASLPLGLATSIAVIAHEIPQEISDFGVLIHAGYSRAKALALNFITALAAIAGAVVALIIGLKIENFIDCAIPFTAGGFIYIATADLIPELKKEPHLASSLRQLISILIGILIMFWLKNFLN
jgi:zinc and cadmium transporter